jgi:hypothetical protein
VPVARRHLHLLEGHDVITAFYNVLYLIHPGLEHGAPGFDWNIEMDFAFVADREIGWRGFLRGRWKRKNTDS